MLPLVTLLTDFGTADYYVGAVKGTLLRLAPEARLVDLSHEVPRGDVEAAADLLAAAAPTFPAGTVHLAVVDPGVGSERRILVVEARGYRLVAPDNGLLSHFLPPRDPAGRARSVERSELFLPSPGATFHGRDRFAPLAAALLRGEEAETLGPEVDDPILLAREPPRGEPARDGANLSGRVVRVDHFGNLVTDLPASWVSEGTEAAAGFRVEVSGHRVDRWVTHYAQIPTGEPAALAGSLGTVELSLRGESLAERWRVGRGTPVRIVLEGPVPRPFTTDC